MLRVYCPDWSGGAEVPRLGREELHHLVRVRRVQSGERIEVLNGRGYIGLAEVLQAGQRDFRMEVQSVREEPEASPRTRLLVALPKGKTFPMLLHRAVELGVREIVPLITEHVEVSSARAEGKLERWRAVLVEALKQSGNPWLPGLVGPMALPDALAASAGEGARLCGALQPGARPLWDLLRDGFGPAGWVEVFIGPEGDFSDAEYALLRESGCRFASLGPLVLKVETAASLLAGAIRLHSLATA